MTNGLGVTTFWRLIDFFGDAATVCAVTEKDLLTVPGVGLNHLKNLSSGKAVAELGERQFEKEAAAGNEVVLAIDVEYSKALSGIADPPPVLFVRGKHTLLSDLSIAMVGSRASTSYGRRVSFTLAAELAEVDAVVTSGLALGIDTEAHHGALSRNGKTIAVLGCGLDVVYPKQNRKLYDKITQQGLLVTEYPVGTQPEGFRFPARNRIISGLSEGVVVVEAAKKSGSLITAQMALDENREVFAIPGQIDSFKSEGTHWLLKQGAKLVQGVKDIIEEIPALDELQKNKREVSGDQRQKEPSGSDDPVSSLLNIIEPYPMSREELIQKTGVGPERISEWLLFLELEGRIELLPGDEVRKLC